MCNSFKLGIINWIYNCLQKITTITLGAFFTSALAGGL